VITGDDAVLTETTHNISTLSTTGNFSAKYSDD